jgi:hypothetical protein
MAKRVEQLKNEVDKQFGAYAEGMISEVELLSWLVNRFHIARKEAVNALQETIAKAQNALAGLDYKEE